MCLIVAALFFCAAGGAQPSPAPAAAPATQPATTQPSGPETVAAARARLVPPHRPAPARPTRSRRSRGRPARPAPAEPTPERSPQLAEPDIALLAVLDLTLALGRANGPAAAGLIDAVGYQALPLRGELPECPSRPIPREEIGTLVAARKPAPLESLPVSGFAVVRRDALRRLFPAVADWMLPTDWAVVIHPSDVDVAWARSECCLVVRVRARQPAILGGSLFEALQK